MTLDELDRAIIDILRRDARISVSEIARTVGLSSAPVSRRIARLERTGVIKGYVAVIDEEDIGGIEAFTEVRLVGSLDPGEIEDIARGIREIKHVFTIAGDPDALLHFRADSVEHLQRVVNAIRCSGKVASTKTLIVMKSWDQTFDTR